VGQPMSRTAKIVLIVLGSFVVIAVCVLALGVLLWVRHGPSLIDAGARQFEEGAAYGQQTDEQGCLDQAVARYKSNSGIGGAMGAGIFAQACWGESQPTSGFCDSVPKPLDVFRAQRWQAEQSRKAGIDNELGGQIFVQLRNYCAAKPPTAQPPTASPSVP
jgi:hypothetical protein